MDRGIQGLEQQLKDSWGVVRKIYQQHTNNMGNIGNIDPQSQLERTLTVVFLTCPMSLFSAGVS